MHSPEHLVTTTAQLDALYDQPLVTSLEKEVDHITPDYAKFIAAAPFVVLASVGEEGLDCSPRGDAAGFVRIADPKTLMIPDRRGNNRIDTLRNLVRDPRISLLFLIPGIGETIRVNGRAAISTDPLLCESFRVDGKSPRTVLIVSVETVYFQCQKALVRSKLWDPATRLERSALPSTGSVLQKLSRGDIDGARYDAEAPARIKETIY